MANVNFMKVTKSIIGDVDDDDQSDVDIHAENFDEPTLNNRTMTLPTRGRSTGIKSRYESGHLTVEENPRISNYPPFNTPQPFRKNLLVDPHLPRAHSPNPYGTQNRYLQSPISHIRSRSFDIVPTSVLAQQLTDDSGTGESVELHIDQHHTTFPKYELVRIFGQTTKASMRNRCEFDQAIVNEYLERKCKTHSVTNNKQHMNTSLNFREKFKNLFSGNKKPKTTRNNSLFNHPLVRYHPSSEPPTSS